jgi:cytochrome c nitrite reductase small subunit
MDFAKLRNVVVGLAIGVVVGIGGYTFIYARGYSYMTDDPQACVNCHVMREQFDGWVNSSHRSVATCNDCHTPPGFVGKYVTKARNGFWHSFYFTTGRFPEPIRITGHNREVAEQSCRKCHSELAESIEGPHQQAGASNCLRCHDTVGHRTRK